MADENSEQQTVNSEQPVEKPNTVKLQFAPAQKSATLEIANGEYHRTFDVKDQPFEAEAAEEAPMLLRTKHFVVVKEEEAAKGEEQSVAGPKSKVQSPKSDTQGKIGGAPADKSEDQSAKS